jgi:nucleotide-binding universal stress UspA family protein
VLLVDGSDATGAAVGFVAELAARLGVGVTAVWAFEPLPEWVVETDPRSWGQQSELAVQRWVEPITNAGVNVQIVIDGDLNPVAAITRALDAHPGSASVIGTGDLSGVTGLRLARLPLQVVHHTAVPVILVPVQPA